MRIAISADGNQGLDSPVGQHFGRYLIVHILGEEVEHEDEFENL
jgi:predicted Fe-Mo cluster-binding NifX family protein